MENPCSLIHQMAVKWTRGYRKDKPRAFERLENIRGDAVRSSNRGDLNGYAGESNEHYEDCYGGRGSEAEAKLGRGTCPGRKTERGA